MSPEVAGLPTLLVRADGGAGIGSGHLGRCLALAQAWIDRGGTVTLAARRLPADWDRRYRAEGVRVVAPGPLRHAPVAWAVLDGYGISAADRREVRALATRLLVIDDHGTTGPGQADLILDQNAGASTTPYQLALPSAELLLGTRYALLRRDFAGAHAAARPVPARAGRVLVAMGGSSASAVAALAGDVTRGLAERGMVVRMLDGVDDVAAVMAEADLAVAAAGSTTWELCCSGLPAVLVSAADNQRPLAAAAHAQGAALDAGSAEEVGGVELVAAVVELAADPDRRAAMSRAGRALVDGRGAKRVVARMMAVLLDLRPATQADARLVWEWANDPVARQASFTSGPIPWETHQEWFAGILASSTRHLYLAVGPGGRPVGQIRFEGPGGTVEVAVNVAPAWRNRGWGAALVVAGVRRLFAHTESTAVVARIKAANTASRMAFADAGFTFDAEGIDEGGAAWVRYVRRRAHVDDDRAATARGEMDR